MHFISTLLFFLLELTSTSWTSRDSTQFSWSCHLTSLRRFECRNLYNFYLSSYSLCADDFNILIRQRIDELVLINDHNCFDQQWQCYFEFDSTWSKCFRTLRKLTVANLSFIVRLNPDRYLLPLDYLKIENTHGSITDLLNLFQFSNRSSIYIQNIYPRWSGVDFYSISTHFSSIILDQFWINVLDWYPIRFMKYQEQIFVRDWLNKIRCLHIEAGDCEQYHYDLLFLRDLFGNRRELSSELYCYSDHGRKRFHWSFIRELSNNYILPKPLPNNPLQAVEKHEECFNKFLQHHYTINSDTDLVEFYSNLNSLETKSIPLWSFYPFLSRSTNLPERKMSIRTAPSTLNNDDDRWLLSSKIDFIDIHQPLPAWNETRWLSNIESYPDGRFLLVDNRNQHLLLLDEQGTYRVDLTSIFLRQIHFVLYPSRSSIQTYYSFAQVRIDQDSYVYLIPTLAYQLYIFSRDNRLIRLLTPNQLGISVLRSDCLAITHTGLIYVCDDSQRSVRIYSRMGIPQRTIRFDFLPLKLFVSNTRLFTYTIEQIATIHMYTINGRPIRTVNICAYNILSEVVWFRGKHFLSCGTFIYVLDDEGEVIAEHGLQPFIDQLDTPSTIHDIALNKNGLLLMTFRRNGTLLNRYFLARPVS